MVKTVSSTRYPNDWPQTHIDCPCCRRRLEAVIDYDDDAELYVTLEPVPLREQPCSTAPQPGWPEAPLSCYSPTRPAVRAVSAECDWWRNPLPSHRNPCDGPQPRHYVFTYVWRALWQITSLARCVQED